MVVGFDSPARYSSSCEISLYGILKLTRFLRSVVIVVPAAARSTRPLSNPGSMLSKCSSVVKLALTPNSLANAFARSYSNPVGSSSR